MAKTKEVCAALGCERNSAARGLCSNHYNQAVRYIDQGRTTWERLEAAGRARPPAALLGRSVKNRWHGVVDPLPPPANGLLDDCPS